MINAKTSFYKPETVDLKEFDSIVGAMKRDLADLSSLKSSELTGEERSAVLEHAGALIREARPLRSRSGMMCWTLDEPEHMPGDARADYLYTPTYLATAYLIKAAQLCPELLADRTFTEALRGAMLGCTGRSFTGHGYDRAGGVRRAAEIFALADTDSFLRRNPGLCPEFAELYWSTAEAEKQ